MTRARPRSRLAALAAAATLVLAGCGTAGTPNDPPPAPDGTATGAEPDAAASELSGTVTVFAAASLTDAFGEIAEDFSAANPGVEVVFSFAASSALAQQVVSGAPADVFASASPATMETVVEAGDTAVDPVVFAANRLEIAVPAGNPGGVTGLVDFTDPERTIALCAAEVPCGAAAEQVFEAAGLTPEPDTLESDVRAALSKVQLDEVDAALVYRTDVLSAGEDVEGIEFPEAEEAVNDYPVALLAGAPNPAAGQAFVDFVLSPDGQRVLTGAGFDGP